jgi:hypothetical protein
MFDFHNHAQVIWKNLEQIGITYLLTALIGREREQEAHNAGLRTFGRHRKLRLLADSRRSAQ